MKQKYLGEFDSFFIILIVTIVVLSSPLLIRSIQDKPLLFGEDSYYYARLSESLPDSDNKIYGSRPILFNMYVLILNLANNTLGIELAALLLPFLLGLFSSLLFYNFLGLFGLQLTHRLVTSLILIISPAFIHTFSSLNPESTAVFLNLLGFYLLFKNKSIYLIMGSMLLILSLFFGITNAIITLILLAALVICKPLSTNNKKAIYLFVLCLALVLGFYLTQYIILGFPNIPGFISINYLQKLISDFRSNGFSLFSVLLAGLGVIVSWKNKNKYAVGYILFFVFLALFKFLNIGIFLSFIISIFAGYALITLFTMHWDLIQVKKFTFFILILGLFLSSVSYLNRSADFPPTNQDILALNWLKENSVPDSVVFSHYKNGFLIQTIAGQTVVMDGNFEYIDAEQRFKDSYDLFYNRNLQKTRTLLTKYDISYIYINPLMKQGDVWTREEQGLLFLFRNNETFKNIYQNKGFEIWKTSRGNDGFN